MINYAQCQLYWSQHHSQRLEIVLMISGSRELDTVLKAARNAVHGVNYQYCPFLVFGVWSVLRAMVLEP
ncbi:hypothetical protein C5167_040142 [Papaver somniferum]|uniref:Uncharacterized protein n=1 Tax=Papaver somniferum TaxID=3469 RepID=A0A4Y7IE21_PAPSO|nr:hypothetical protein C5167_040142 [Papaver somniferum]